MQSTTRFDDPSRGAMHHAWLALATIGLTAAIAPAAAAGLEIAGATSWDGSCGNQFWHSTCGVMNGTTNWNDDNIPTLGTPVSIPLGSPTVRVLNNAAAASVSCLSALTIESGAALELAGSSVIHNLTMNSGSSFGLQIDSGEMLLETSCNWTLGRMTGAGSVKNRGTMTGTPEVQGSITFFNQGTASLKGMTIGSSAAAVNGTGSSLTLGVTLPVVAGSLTGTGQFTNLGTLVTQHHPTSYLDIACPFVQHAGGSLQVSGPTTGPGTRFENSATFDGGSLTISDDSHLRFRQDGGGTVIYTFNGLPAITGNGNMHLEMPPGTQWRVENDLAVNLTGTNGFVLNSGNVLLSAMLKNQAQATWSGALLQQTACGACAPEFRNEGTLHINSSGVILNTLLTNQPGSLASQELGGLQFGVNGQVANTGLYQHLRGSMTRAGVGATTGTFFNNAGGYFVRPASDTQDVTISAAFVIDSGSTAEFNSALTTFAGNPATGEGLFLQGGDVSVWSPAVVRIATGRVQSGNQTVYGDGEFHIGGAGGNTDFLIQDDEFRRFDAELGASGGNITAASTAGLYLDTGAHIGGPGFLNNQDVMYLSGGTVGVGGAGRVRNYADAYMLNSTGVNGVNARLENHGYMRETATLTMNDGKVENYYDWHVAGPCTLQSFGAGVFQNLGSGVFYGDPGAGNLVTVSSKFDNQGLAWAQSGTLNVTGNVLQLSGGTLSGGDWAVDPLATLDLPGTITTIGPNAHVTYHALATFDDLKPMLTNGGHLEVDGLNFNNPFVNDGWLELGGTVPVKVQNGAGNVNNGTSGGQSVLTFADNKVVPALALRGGARGGAAIPFALLCANFNNYATVRPGGPNTPGPFKMDGNYNQSSTGTLQIELGGSTPIDGYDQLIVDGNVTLGGILSVRILPGFAPAPGQQFTIISASNGSISGTFDQVQGFGTYRVSYAPNSVTLTVVNPPKPGDANGDGLVNVNDLLAVINYWGLCPLPPTFCIGDLNGDGQVNVNDLLAVINHWGS